MSIENAGEAVNAPPQDGWVRRLLTPSEVAAMFRVDPKTVTRWAKAGHLNAIRTPGGHRRYPADEVEEFLAKVADPRRKKK